MRQEKNAAKTALCKFASPFIVTINTVNCYYFELEIKPCGLGSRIRDMEPESYN